MKASELLVNVVNLFYPKLCLACESETCSGNIPVCVSCLAELPLADMHNDEENMITERLLGRVEIQNSAALFYFTKKGRVQQLIHQAKYSGDPVIARMLGQWMGRYLQKSGRFTDIDVVVPVPLHPLKQEKRGYNQSAEFGQGIAEILSVSCMPNVLKRNRQSVSQTKGNRTERLSNVLESFEADKINELQSRHILLVDDVLTTGATIEACATKILNVENTKLSICVMAVVTD